MPSGRETPTQKRIRNKYRYALTYLADKICVGKDDTKDYKIEKSPNEIKFN